MSVSMKYVLAFMGILRWDVIEPEFHSSHFTFDKKWTFIWSSYVTLCHKKTGPEMNNSTFTTCMMPVWQGGCASNYLHCGTVTHERLGGHKVISLSLRHHPVSYLLVSFFSGWCLFRRIRIVEVYYWVISQYWQALVMVLLPLDLPGTYSINYNHSHYTNVNRFCFCFPTSAY